MKEKKHTADYTNLITDSKAKHLIRAHTERMWCHRWV